MPDSSSSLRMLRSGALADGRMERFEEEELSFVAELTGSVGSNACMRSTSDGLCALEDTLSFHILPSCWEKKKPEMRLQPDLRVILPYQAMILDNK